MFREEIVRLASLSSRSCHQNPHCSGHASSCHRQLAWIRWLHDFLVSLVMSNFAWIWVSQFWSSASSVFFEVIYTAYMETRAPQPEKLGRNLTLSVSRKVNEVSLWQIGPLSAGRGVLFRKQWFICSGFGHESHDVTWWRMMGKYGWKRFKSKEGGDSGGLSVTCLPLWLFPSCMGAGGMSAMQKMVT